MNRARFRDGRVFHVDEPHGEAGGWYFEVRDGPPQGPYLTRDLAEHALTEYTGEVSEAQEDEAEQPVARETLQHARDGRPRRKRRAGLAVAIVLVVAVVLVFVKFLVIALDWFGH